MEIIKRKKHGNTGDVLPFYASEKVVRDEVNCRTAKAGYTNRQGEQTRRTKIMALPANERYRKNYVKIFGHN